MKPKVRRIFGVDPGLGRLGWAVVESRGQALTMVEAGTLTTPPNTHPAPRLLHLHRRLGELIREFKPDLVALEQLFFTKNVTTGIAVGQARGIVLLAAAEAGLPTAEFTPTRVKQTVTGYGRADKRQMQTMVKMLFKLKTMPATDDAVDAIAVALCGAQHPLPA